MPHCGKCGSQLQPNAKFCGACGAAQTSPGISSSPSTYYPPPTAPYPPPPPPPPDMKPNFQAAPPPSVNQTAQAGGEPIVGVIVLRKPKSLGRYDSYAGVVTSQRLIFAQLTADMINTAAQNARDQAKAEGKGFFGQWADQLKNTFGFTNRYLAMAPEAIIAETAGNFALANSGIAEIKIRLKGELDNRARRYFEAEFKSSSGNYKFHLDENNQFADLLKKVYGNRVKMPFGYHSTSINIRF